MAKRKVNELAAISSNFIGYTFKIKGNEVFGYNMDCREKNVGFITRW